MSIFSRKKEQEIVHEISDEEKRGLDFASCGGEFIISKRPGKHGALALSAVFACVEMIANSIASMDINVKSKKTRSRISMIPLQNLFYKNKLSKFNIIKNLVSDMLLYGNGFCKIERATDGTVVGLQYLSAENVSAFYNDNVDDTYFMYKGERLLPGELIHIFKNTYNGYIGVPVITFASRSLQLANCAEDCAVDYYSSGLNINALIHATDSMTQHQAEQAVRSMQNAFSPTTRSGGIFKFVPYDIEMESFTQTA